MGKPEPAVDPSMEEILASIRKIIAEDSAPVSPVRQAPQLAVVQEPPDEPVVAAFADRDPAPNPTAIDDHSPVTRVGAAEAPDMVARTTAEPRVKGVPLSPDRDHAARLNVRPSPPDSTEPEAKVARLHEPAPRHAADGSHDEAAAGSAVRQMASANASDGRTESSDREDFLAPKQERPQTRDDSSYRPQPSHAPERKAEQPEKAEHSLLSPHADEAVQSAFDQLAHTILGNQTRTLEDLVQELMRPMLRNWLDDNLPVLVERLVREEIERVSRGRR